MNEISKVHFIGYWNNNIDNPKISKNKEDFNNTEVSDLVLITIEKIPLSLGNEYTSKEMKDIKNIKKESKKITEALRRLKHVR